MGSSFHYTIDLNEDQIDQPLFYPLHHNNHQHDHHHHHYHHHVPSNISSSSSSLTSPSLSHLPFLINSHQDQLHVGYNNNTFHGILDPHLSQSLETKKFVSNGGSPISSDQVVPKKDTRLKLTIRKKDNHHEQVKLMKRKRLMITITDNNKQHVNNDQSLNQRNFEGDHHDHLKKVSTNQYNTIFNETGYEGGNNCVIRICSDCNTTKTPLWRSGPRGPKSLCNACGIRQRKARQAAVAAAAATTNSEYLSPPLLKKKMQRKNKRSNEVSNLSSPLAPKVKKGKSMTTSVMEGATSGDLENQGKSTVSSSSASSSSNKFYYDDLAVILSKSSAYQQVFPQDEKEAAILLMALSYGMVHG